ncbi:MAG TPA: MarR family transcriptional regulator [Candidatus Thorarchaeota archaeon]|nr:MAG: MarR family transcriptional regulator [Candidatus Thorarchaeota archaeon]RLI62566.1 MAG: MarR family transcriptional regulator [Candidatus Thorarchaeota archaeon]HDD67360.1 MarR family transcriptional regulator [Candidatus Thorarchaeota archaeon]
MMTDAELQEELKDMKLTKSQMIVLEILRSSGKDGVTPKQLLDKVSFAPRTVRYALRKLLKKKLIKRVPCLQDMRQYIYIPA